MPRSARGRRSLELMQRVAKSDTTFMRTGTRWIGKCLICNGWLSFDLRDGIGANLEHIVPRTAGGSSDLANLALTHPQCNGEKGRHWDNARRRRGRDAEYEALLARLQERRRARWREPESAATAPPAH
jgi:5-methylcytosine-specific restriction endonuclease McrA